MSDQAVPNLLRHRIKFLAIVAVFLLPFIAGWLALYVFDYRPGSKNYGDLVQPVKPLQFPSMNAINDKSLDQAFWSKWTFVLLDRQGCTELCQQNLYYLRQMRIALGRDVDRVQNVLLTDQALSAEFNQFLQEYPDLTVVQNTPAEVFKLFTLDGRTVPGSAPMLYLIDPANNLMMTYPASHDASAVLSDMRRLLKVSQIG